MSRVSQYMHLKMKYDNAVAANEKESINDRLLDEMDEIWEGAPECDQLEITRLACKS